MHMLRHIILISSIGLASGWAMVEFRLATVPLIAGTIIAAAFVTLYLALALVYWLVQLLCSKVDTRLAASSLLGHDSRGRLRIHSNERRW